MMIKQAIEGVPKIRAGYNPAAWVLEVTSTAEESRLGVDFAEIYRRSDLFQYVLSFHLSLSVLKNLFIFPVFVH